MSTQEAPETLEGWYVQHEMYTVNWAKWRATPAAQRAAVIETGTAWCTAQATPAEGSSAFFSVLGQKGDLLLVHFRPNLEALNTAELTLRQTELFTFMQPVYSYLSVIELGLYEVIGAVQRQLATTGLDTASPAYEAAYQQELAVQKTALRDRLYPDMPAGRYLCFYPMDKKRGETHNWYALPMEERRNLMRGHGMIGRKYAGKVTQIISGSVGLDDWEWGVSLFADDPLVFKKLIYEMRFDAASALYALFGSFYVGVRFQPSALGMWLSGTLPA